MPRYIDAEKAEEVIIESTHDMLQDTLLLRLYSIPSANVEEIVRCKDCKLRYSGSCFSKHETADNDFCSNGRKRDQHGKWVYSSHACGYYMSGMICSECGYGIMEESLPECPNCGAKMDLQNDYVEEYIEREEIV